MLEGNGAGGPESKFDIEAIRKDIANKLKINQLTNISKILTNISFYSFLDLSDWERNGLTLDNYQSFLKNSISLEFNGKVILEDGMALLKKLKEGGRINISMDLTLTMDDLPAGDKNLSDTEKKELLDVYNSEVKKYLEKELNKQVAEFKQTTERFFVGYVIMCEICTAIIQGELGKFTTGQNGQLKLEIPDIKKDKKALEKLSRRLNELFGLEGNAYSPQFIIDFININCGVIKNQIPQDIASLKVLHDQFKKFKDKEHKKASLKRESKIMVGAIIAMIGVGAAITALLLAGVMPNMPGIKQALAGKGGFGKTIGAAIAVVGASIGASVAAGRRRTKVIKEHNDIKPDMDKLDQPKTKAHFTKKAVKYVTLRSKANAMDLKEEKKDFKVLFKAYDEKMLEGEKGKKNIDKIRDSITNDDTYKKYKNKFEKFHQMMSDINEVLSIDNVNYKDSSRLLRIHQLIKDAGGIKKLDDMGKVICGILPTDAMPGSINDIITKAKEYLDNLEAKYKAQKGIQEKL